MTEEEILTKAIEKAVKNGFYENTEKVEVIVEPRYKIIQKVCLHGKIFIPNPFQFHPLEIIFCFPFAKAFWGEHASHTLKGNNLRCECGAPFTDRESSCPKGKPVWKYHLQQMVISEDPIMYLRDFI